MGLTQVGQRPCEIGYFCHFGVKAPCPAGYVGTMFANNTPSCATLCPVGHYCLSGAAMAVNALNGDLIYLNNRIFPCPGGTYGDVAGLSLPSCSGECSPGYFCPPKSISSTQNYCGSAAYYCPPASVEPLPASDGYYTISSLAIGSTNSVYMTHQLPCDAGNYCIGGVRSACPAGTFGQDGRLSTPACSGLCQKGFYCPAGKSLSA